MILHAIKLLLAFTALVTTISSFENEIQTDSFVTQEAQIHSNDYEPSISFPSSVSFNRYRRATPETLKESIEKMEMIARLTNVIYLQQGLTNATIKPDVLIPELLHFGSVTLADINSLDSTKIETALNALKDFPSDIQPDSDTSNLETAFSIFKDVLEELKDVTSEIWTGKAQYKADLQQIENHEVDLNSITDLKAQMNGWVVHHNLLKNSASQTTFTAVEFNRVTDLLQVSEKLIQAAANFKTKSPVFFEFEGNKKAEQAIELLMKVSKNVKRIHENIEAESSYDFTNLETKVQKSSATGKLMNGVSPQLEIVKNFFFSLSHPFLTSSQVTAGMPHGYDDVGKVSVDMNDKWLKAAMKNGTLAKSYPSVQSLGTSVAGIQKKLGGVHKNAIVSISQIVDETMNLKTFSNFPITAAKDTLGCFVGFSTKPDLKEDVINKLSDSAKEIDGELERLQGVLKSAVGVVDGKQKELNVLVEKMQKIDSSDASDFTELLNLKELNEVYTSFDKVDWSKTRDDDLVQFAKNSIEKVDELQNYETIANYYFKFINCLKNKGEAPKAISAFEAAKALQSRSNNDALYGEGLKYAKIVIDSKSGLKSLESAILSANGTKTLESSSLNLLGQADVHTQVLGLSTRAVVNMKTLLDKKGVFDVITKHSDLIKNEKNKYSSLVAADQTLLDNLATLGPSIDKMFNELDAWKVEVEKLTFSNLEDYSNIFAKAKNVQGLSVDVGKINEVVGKLIAFVEKDTNNPNKQNTITSLKEVQNALETLDELQFSKYSTNFDKTKSSLSTVDLFFADYLKETTKKIAAANAPKVIVVTAQAPKINKDTAEKENEVKVWWVVCAVVGPLLLGLIIFLIWWLFFKKRTPVYKKYKRLDCPMRAAIGFLTELKWKVDSYTKSFPPPEQSNTPEEEAKRIDKLYRFLGSTYETIDKSDETVSQLVLDHRSETRYPVNLAGDNRVKVPVGDGGFPNDYLHANEMVLFNKQKVVIMQGATQNDGIFIDNQPKIWRAAFDRKTQAIFLFCAIEERGVPQCSQYYPLEENDILEMGSLSIKCTSNVRTGDYVTRKITITNKEGETHSLTLFQLPNFVSICRPGLFLSFRTLVETMNGYEDIIIQCRDGVRRSGVAALALKLYLEICNSKDGKHIDIGELLRELRKARIGCIASAEELTLAVRIALDIMFCGKDAEDKKPPKGQKPKKNPTKIPYYENEFLKEIERGYDYRLANNIRETEDLVWPE